MTGTPGDIGMHDLRLSGRAASASRANPVPPPPPPKTGCGAEPVGALGRTARRLKAGLAALFLIALGAALAPQDAQAQDQTPVLTAAPGPGQVMLSWTTSSLGFTTQWRYRQKEGAGEYGGWQNIPGGAGIRSHTIGGLTAGVAYTFQVTGAYLTGVARVITNYANPSNEASATPTAVPSVTLTVTRIGRRHPFLDRGQSACRREPVGCPLHGGFAGHRQLQFQAARGPPTPTRSRT